MISAYTSNYSQGGIENVDTQPHISFWDRLYVRLKRLAIWLVVLSLHNLTWTVGVGSTVPSSLNLPTNQVWGIGDMNDLVPN